MLHGTSSDEPMRLHATRESCDQGEITILAVVETVLAVALLITLSLWFDTTHWLSGACLLAPLVLLRTEDSVQRGLRMLPSFRNKRIVFQSIISLSISAAAGAAIKISTWWAILCLLPFTAVAFAVSVYPHLFVIRFAAAFISVIKHPLQSLSAIPGNWRRVVLATDGFLDPEFLPGDPEGPLRMVGLWKSESVFTRWFWLTCFVTIYPFTAAYRWSVKATCIVYLPLVWLVNKARYRTDSTQHMLSDYLADEIQTVRRWALGLTGGFLIVKIIVLMRVDEIVAAVKTNVPSWGLSILRTLHPYLTPRHIELWQLTPVLNGLLAVGMWLYARRMLRLGDRAPTAGTIQLWWNVMSCLTLVLSLYSIACLLKITWDHGDLLGTLHRLYEAIEWRFFPQTAKP